MLSVEEHYPEGCFGLDDVWLRPRARQILRALLERPGAPVCAWFSDEASRKGAYRLLEQKELGLEELLSPAHRALAARLREGDRTQLCLSDTTDLELPRVVRQDELGAISNPDKRGLKLHTALVVSEDGRVGGVLDARSWRRAPEERGKAQERRETSFEGKESSKWWRCVERCEERVGQPGRLVHVMDREGDAFELFARASATGARLLVRSAHSRKIRGPKGALLHDWAHRLPVRGWADVELPRAGRVARLSVRFGEVQLLGPHERVGDVAMWAVLVREEELPEDVDERERVEWLLLTNEPLRTLPEALRRVGWYRQRWLMEELHKLLKSVCKLEERPVGGRQALENLLAFVLPAAARLLALRGVERDQPELPARAVMAPDEYEMLELFARRRGERVGHQGLTAEHAIRLLADLGGHRRYRREPPGPAVLWRGYMRLLGYVDAAALLRFGPAGPLASSPKD